MITPELRVVRAFRGPTSGANGWHACSASHWTLDYYLRGPQRQRLGDASEFLRDTSTAALYAPGTCYHEYRGPGQTFEEAWLLFEPGAELAAALRQLSGAAGACHLRDPRELIRGRLIALSEAVLREGPGLAARVTGVALELLGQCLEARQLGAGLFSVGDALDATEASLVTRLEHFVEAHLQEPLQVGDVAAHLHMSESALAHRYPEVAGGETPYRAILRVKLAAGRRLLLREGLSVGETAARLGFANPFSFSRTFRQHEGLAPSQYVARMRRKA